MLTMFAGVAELDRRSREGAWIEMAFPARTITVAVRRSREGAWIEIRELKFLTNMSP